MEPLVYISHRLMAPKMLRGASLPRRSRHGICSTVEASSSSEGHESEAARDGKEAGYSSSKRAKQPLLSPEWCEFVPRQPSEALSRREENL